MSTSLQVEKIKNTSAYWESRKENLYYRAVLQYVQTIGYDAKSLIDVGGGPTPIISWFDWIPRRCVIDRHLSGTRAEGVDYIAADFLEWQPPEIFDVAICLQVLEHIEDVRAFATKLKEICRHLIISVPYNWQGGTPGHIHDPVDHKKTWTWFRIAPNYSQVFPEPFGPPRLIQYYDLVNGPSTRFDLAFVRKAIAERPARF